MIDVFEVKDDWLNINVVEMRKNQKQITVCPAIHYAKKEHYSEINKILSEKELVVSEGVFYDLKDEQPGQQLVLNNEHKMSFSISNLSEIGQLIISGAFGLKSQNFYKFTYNKIIGDLSYSEFLKLENKNQENKTDLNELIEQNFQITNYVSQIFISAIKKDYDSLTEFYLKIVKGTIEETQPSILININEYREKNAIMALDNAVKNHDQVGIHYGAQHVNNLFHHLESEGYEIKHQYLLPAIPLSVTKEYIEKNLMNKNY